LEETPFKTAILLQQFNSHQCMPSKHIYATTQPLMDALLCLHKVLLPLDDPATLSIEQWPGLLSGLSSIGNTTDEQGLGFLFSFLRPPMNLLVQKPRQQFF